MFIMRLPKLGMSMADGEIIEWLVEEGQVVEKDTPLVEIESSKASTVLNAPEAGTIRKLYAEEGDVLDIGDPLVAIGDPDEPLPEDV